MIISNDKITKQEEVIVMPIKPIRGRKDTLSHLPADPEDWSLFVTRSRLRLVTSFVNCVFLTREAHILSASRGRQQLSAARHTLHYLSHVVFGINFTQLGKLTLRDRTSVANGCRRIEDSRDDPDADKLLFFSELALNEMDIHMHGGHAQGQNGNGFDTR
jgi:hypothetical protein